jgi:hypothetical protein
VRCVVPTLIVLAALTLSALPAFADGSTPEVFTHEEWDTVLSRFVNEQGQVDYAALDRDRASLDRYLLAIGEIGPRTTPERFPTREHELAYYINAYNALIFAGVLERGPEAESVWSGFPQGLGFFVMKKYRIDGQEINLRNLENKLVRAKYGDARVHAALNCASTGCPRLPAAAFQPGELDRTLNEAMTDFVTDEKNVRLDSGARTVYLSKIFDWFKDDFLADEREVGNTKPTLIDYVNRFRGDAPPLPRDYAVRFLEYDKSLNRAPVAVAD